MDDDAWAIMNGTPPMVPGEDGLKDIVIFDAIFASAKYGGARIALY
jgi:glucose-fructose oxidoreductase